MSSSADRAGCAAARVAAGVAVAACAAVPLHAQDLAAGRTLAPTDLGGVMVSVVLPDAELPADGDTRRLLEARMAGALAGAGVAGVASLTPFVMYPLLTVVDEAQVDGGLVPRTTVSVELTFVVRHLTSRSVMHQWTVRLAGTADSRREAVRHAVASLRPTSDALGAFGAETRRRIVDYYARSCDAVRASARAAAAAGRLQEAVAELAAVPTDAAACQRAAARDLDDLSRRRVGTGATGRLPASPAPPRRASSAAPARVAPATARDAVAYFTTETSRLLRFDYTRP